MNTRSIILTVNLLLTLSTSMAAAPGDLDPTFGNGGIAIANIPAIIFYTAGAMAIQPDGKIVVAGEGTTGGYWDSATVRFNPDGSLDSSFGGTGGVVTRLSDNFDGAMAVAIQPDGKIVIVSSVFDGAWGKFGVVRYNPNGSLDTSFNGSGIVLTPVGSAGGPNSVAIQTDGKIVVAGSDGNDSFAIVRYNPNGSLDTTFDGSGKVLTPVGRANSVAIQADGKIIAAGGVISGSSFTLVRYNADGSLDTSFNGTGIVSTPARNSWGGASDLAIQTDGKIVAVGYSVDFAAVRYNPDGSLDSSFGGAGKILIPADVYVRSVAIQPNGKFVVAGITFIDGDSVFAVGRLNPNGSVDTSFNGTGVVITSIGKRYGNASYDEVGLVAIQADDKIVVAGDSGPDEFKSFVVVRYQGDGATPTPTPTPTATATPTPMPTPTPIPSPALRANGKIAFTSERDGNQEIYVMNADGTNQIRITNNTIVDDHPMWSPDGTKLAFVSQREAGGFAIFQMNMDGTNRVEITPLSNFVNTPPSVPVGFSMSWSPDGRKIAFQDPYYNDIWVVDVETHARRNLTNDGGGQIALYDYHPAWSPDGSTILYASPRYNGFCPSLYAINPEGTNRRLLSGNHCPAFSPSWSPDGTQIVFVQLNGEFAESELRIANSDGTNVRIFDGGDPDPNSRDYPRWSPDGRKIAFNMTNGQDIEIYVKNVDGTGYAQLTNTPAGQNYRPSWQPLEPAACPNPIDCVEFFVRQHYLDFLNREPDAGGLSFWTNEIASCGNYAQCIEAKRISVSAAYFLSIEFQQTGYEVYRFYKTAFGNISDAPVPVRLSEFLPDSQRIGQGVIVNQSGWEQVLENNKQAFASDFVQRSRFSTAFPPSTSAAEFVDKLNSNARNPLSQSERDQLVSELATGMKTRAQVLRAVAEDVDLVTAEFNRAFVLMQYFGYLRRNPNDAPDSNFDGYNFWLNKLNTFNGNFTQAEMVKAFITADEYRRRFGP